jgi:hypothetical protein
MLVNMTEQLSLGPVPFLLSGKECHFKTRGLVTAYECFDFGGMKFHHLPYRLYELAV